MDKTILKIKIIASLGMNSIEYRNLTRALFESWALVIANKQNLLLENITMNNSIWQWYLEELEIIEKQFYKENKEYINGLFDAKILKDVFISMVSDLENNYPSVLIKTYCYNGQKIQRR